MWLRSHAARQTTQGVKPHFLLNALQLTTTYYVAAASHGGQIEIPAKKMIIRLDVSHANDLLSISSR